MRVRVREHVGACMRTWSDLLFPAIFLCVSFPVVAFIIYISLIMFWGFLIISHLMILSLAALGCPPERSHGIFIEKSK